MIAPVPTPWTKRQAMACSMVVAWLASSAPTTWNPSPANSTGRRPYQSASLPKIGPVTVQASRNAVNSQPSRSAPRRSPAMRGAAPPTITTSSATTPNTSPSAHSARTRAPGSAPRVNPASPGDRFQAGSRGHFRHGFVFPPAWCDGTCRPRQTDYSGQPQPEQFSALPPAERFTAHGTIRRARYRRAPRRADRCSRPIAHWESQTMPDWDVVVVGAGSNGLVLAGELAARGLRVLALEARLEAGGLL